MCAPGALLCFPLGLNRTFFDLGALTARAGGLLFGEGQLFIRAGAAELGLVQVLACLLRLRSPPARPRLAMASPISAKMTTTAITITTMSQVSICHPLSNLGFGKQAVESSTDRVSRDESAAARSLPRKGAPVQGTLAMPIVKSLVNRTQSGERVAA